ncbi:MULTISPECIES: sugar kinase [Bacillus]|uniref:sugar kinase n=1 Tax=Bacillus TaxID=1386 RepID=UPI000517FC24|nr:MULTISPECIES: sugar kinase [Bacillus]AJK65566.1 2-keto-3-deoxygluconokinase [Bacillus amyloliquefaciens KHG19]ANB83917.1 2-keto-3-deoxygluconate kinase [Bacillus velezensis]ATL39698.1 sugar kinase [Bacillus velezensis]ATV01347.1 sugar kinase [Bacillus velezensis]AWG38447.1 sugar kinase [Bacillus velezensis]
MASDYGIFTIGDAMITLNPASTGPLRFVTHFERKAGGAELNFAIACARLNLHSKWVSRLGKDEFGRVIYQFAKGEGIDVTDVSYVEGFPTSLNVKEIRNDGSGKTFYYRFNSPILTLAPEDITENMFAGIHIVHLTGVFLALDKKNLEIAERVLSIAKARGIPVSFDPNIRLKLWTIEEARAAFHQIFPHTDILLAGRDEMKQLTGIGENEALARFAETYSISQLVIKDGEAGSALYHDHKWIHKEAFPVAPVDTVGAGDGFNAGYLYSYLHGFEPEKRLEFANAVGALVTTVSGDNEGLPYLEEVLSFVNKETVIER